MTSIQTIMRTSAIIYAEESSARNSKTVKRHFVEATLVSAENNPLTVEQVIASLQTLYELVILEDEIKPLLDDERYFVRINGERPEQNTYYLPKNRYDAMNKKAQNNLGRVIDEYVSQRDDIEPKQLIDLLHRYLYNLLNTNIQAFNQLLERKQDKVSPVVNVDSFEDSDIEQINHFLKWENPDKDRALFEIVNYCIDYASAINSINQNDIINALRNKCLYLDNSLIYRALGINGEYRKERAKNLLRRCVDSGQTIYISSVTRKEFFETIDYHLKQLNSTTPYGSINPSLFRKYSNGSFYQYYHEWRRQRDTYGYTALRLHIQEEYNRLIKEYSITEDFKQLFTEDDSIIIEKYTEGIKEHKWQKNQNLIENDSKNMLWIEKARGACDHNVKDTKYYFLTTDRKLQEWDLYHSKNQPITMLPSQWLALLLKFFSQSNNDYKSFVSFLSIPKDKVEVSPEELQEVLAGISEITEDFQRQEDIVSSLIEIDGTLNLRNRFEAKKYAKEQIESQLQNELSEQRKRYEKQLNETKNSNEQQIAEIKESYEAIVKSIKDEFGRRDKDAKKSKLEDKLQTINHRIEDYNKIKNIINDKVNDADGMIKRAVGVIYFIIICVWIWLIIKVGWDTMEMWTYIIGVVLFGIPIIGLLITNKDINPTSLFDAIRKSNYNKQCLKYSYSDSEIIDLEQMKEKIEEQLKAIDS